MVLPFDAEVVGRVEVEEEELLAEGDGTEQLGELLASLELQVVEEERESCIDEEGKRYQGVFKVVEMVWGDGPVWV